MALITLRRQTVLVLIISAAISGQLIVITVCNGDERQSGSVVTIEAGQNASGFGLGSNRITNPSAPRFIFY